MNKLTIEANGVKLIIEQDQQISDKTVKAAMEEIAKVKPAVPQPMTYPPMPNPFPLPNQPLPYILCRPGVHCTTATFTVKSEDLKDVVGWASRQGRSGL